jgi:hypothetical protein
MVKKKKMRKVEKKEAVIAIRPSIKATAEKLARHEGRSLANYLEQLIECAAESRSLNMDRLIEKAKGNTKK